MYAQNKEQEVEINLLAVNPAAYFKVLRSRAVKPMIDQKLSIQLVNKQTKTPFKTVNILFNCISGFNRLPHNCILNAANIDICKVTSGR